MQILDDQIHLSATDLARHLGCAHLTELERLAAAKKLERPHRHDPMREVLEKRGLEHEAAYIEHLRNDGARTVEKIPGFEVTDEACAATLAAMEAGTDVIVQAALRGERWRGRADVLLRVEEPTGRWAWSYEVVDTKLSMETRPGTILQLCLYSELLEELQGAAPVRMHVVTPAAYHKPDSYRLGDFLAYHRLVKNALANATGAPPAGDPALYPEPCPECDWCRWWPRCNERRRADEHLSLVAGATRLQRGQLAPLGFDTVTKLAGAPAPLAPRPKRGSKESYERIREQARVQVASRGAPAPVWEPLEPIAPDRGLARLPAPSPGDVFFDFESDPFAEDGGREYLFGWVALSESGTPEYKRRWALTAEEERLAFEEFIDRVMARLAQHPDLHVYHFGIYEPAAFKRLAGKYATRDDDLDRLLRGKRFIDLHAVVRQGMRVGVERYGLKELEPLHGFTRTLDLREASKNLRAVERLIELGGTISLPAEGVDAVETYNRDDCLSTLSLRDWLEEKRDEVAGPLGVSIPRPELEAGDPSDEAVERKKELQELFDGLTAGLPDDRDAHSDEERARWLLAHLLDWHWREKKATAWEYYRLTELAGEELLDEKAGLAGLELVEDLGVPKRARLPVHRYRYALQEHNVGPGDLFYEGKTKVGTIVALDKSARTVDIRKTGESIAHHPSDGFGHQDFRDKPKPQALANLARWVLENGVDAPGPYRAARDLLLRRPPRVAPARRTLLPGKEKVGTEVRRLVLELDHGVLPVQGPPGAGKTYLGARMICSLVAAGKKVGVTAVSHKVIRNLLDETVEAAAAEGLDLSIVQRVREATPGGAPGITEITGKAEDLGDALRSGGAQVGGATSWSWARKDFEGIVDVLIVDEAGQMSLADTIASAPCAKSVVLLGDPQQLEQPIQGSHPEGCDSSALAHLLDGKDTISPEAGVFLADTYRLHPTLAAFTSHVFYEGRLDSHASCTQQAILGDSPLKGAGLWWKPCPHSGNQSSSPEEVDAVASIFEHLASGNLAWRNQKEEVAPLTSEDVLIVAPYNMQVNALRERLPGARIGTVDKFQGQQAAVVLYSMTASSAEDAPRGMGFLYDLHRLNVATSRARCAVVLVASPAVLEPECRSPEQMRLANAVCWFREVAGEVPGAG